MLTVDVEMSSAENRADRLAPTVCPRQTWCRAYSQDSHPMWCSTQLPGQCSRGGKCRGHGDTITGVRHEWRGKDLMGCRHPGPGGDRHGRLRPDRAALRTVG